MFYTNSELELIELLRTDLSVVYTSDFLQLRVKTAVSIAKHPRKGVFSMALRIKVCAVCNKLLPIEFYDSKGKGRVSAQCKSCVSSTKKKLYKKSKSRQRSLTQKLKISEVEMLRVNVDLEQVLRDFLINRILEDYSEGDGRTSPDGQG